MMLPTLAAVAADLQAGRITAQELAEKSLAMIGDASGQGAACFIRIDPDGILAFAKYQDGLRKSGRAPSSFAGIPIAVKDLFDIAGEVTTAGSVVLKNNAPAKADAPVIARLKSAGFVVISRANMTEFAYSGVGLNAHYGTPLSVYDRKTGRIPGGSSSGSAVAVADGMAVLGIGSDTGGSCRIPAAYNGIVGFKPSLGRVSREGAFPLSSTFDSVGPMGASVQCCATADSIMAGDWDGNLIPLQAANLTLGVFKTLAFDGLDADVAKAFERAMSHLSKIGVRFVDVGFPELAELPQLTRHGGIVAAEALATHSERLAEQGEAFDQRVRSRLEAARVLSASDYVSILRRRQQLAELFRERCGGLQGVILPTVMNVPPPVAALDTMPEYLRYNGMSLRNTYLGNFLDCCALSLPINRPGEAPVGLMIMAPRWQDRLVLSVGAALEACITNT